MRKRRSTGGRAGVWLFLLGSAVVLFLGALAYRWAEREGYFDLRVVRVRGCRAEDSTAVAGVVGPYMLVPLGRIDPGEVSASLSAIEGVTSARVSRSWPSTLIVEVSLAIPAMKVFRMDSGSCLVMGHDGQVLPSRFASDTLPLVQLSSGADTLLLPEMLAWSAEASLPSSGGHFLIDHGCVRWIERESGMEVLLGSCALSSAWSLYERLRDLIPVEGCHELDLRFRGQVVVRRSPGPGAELSGAGWRSTCRPV
ncbi:FtsQ-type POTRA domain-containing protein [Candidatus Fermentibacterales bacterium]|nr:FtsQ-type POTRA domain-containing protein [Candidatus Fermentibacterales bacterium]